MRKKASRRPAAGQKNSGRVHLYVGISLDGYLAAPDGGVGWLDPYQDARAGFTPFIKTIGSTIMGRVTYDWAVNQGNTNFGVPAYVVTHRPITSPPKGVVSWTGDLRELVQLIRARHPKDIWLLGGGQVTRAFAEADLIDLWRVAFVPTVLGAGLPMFPPRPFAELRLKLVKSHTYPSGVVELYYARRLPTEKR